MATQTLAPEIVRGGMKIGAVLPHNEIGTDPGAMRAYAQGLEEMGISNLLIYDHVLGADPDHPGGFKGAYDKDVAFHEPLTTFAFIAAITTRLEMMSAVMILPQRQATLVAKQAAEVAILSGNRFRLGVGIGWNKVEYQALEIPFRRRGDRLGEQVDLMRKLWTEDSLSFEGEFHTVDLASINPRPTELIPVWFGGSAPGAIERCAVMGDGWIPLGSPNDSSRDRIEAIRQHRAAAGLSMDGFGIQAQAQYAGGDPERWRSHAEKWRDLGCTHLAIATHNAGPTDVDGHLSRIGDYLNAITEI
jgi:probable F420-dependent oxidoreductase